MELSYNTFPDLQGKKASVSVIPYLNFLQGNCPMEVGTLTDGISCPINLGALTQTNFAIQ